MPKVGILVTVTLLLGACGSSASKSSAQFIPTSTVATPASRCAQVKRSVAIVSDGFLAQTGRNAKTLTGLLRGKKTIQELFGAEADAGITAIRTSAHTMSGDGWTLTMAGDGSTPPKFTCR